MYTRRNFLGGFAQRLMGELARGADTALDTLNQRLDRAAEERPLTWLRPPGALVEPQFLDTCGQCSMCLEACPHDSIKRLGFEFGAAEGTPAIIPGETPCYLCKDLPCAAACPSGALQFIDRAHARMAVAKIDYAKCYAANGQPCDYCTARCPLGAQAIEMDESSHPRIRLPRCTGCAVCAYLCPADAIRLYDVGVSGAAP